MNRFGRRSVGNIPFAESTDAGGRRVSAVRRRSVSPSRAGHIAKPKASRRSSSFSGLPDLPGTVGTRDGDLAANETLVSVAVRVRPFNAKEVATGAPTRKIVTVLDDGQVVFDPTTTKVLGEDDETSPAFRVPGTRREKNIVYGFDRIFPETATQQEVYEGTAKPLVDSVLQGYNATVFAYGATGCGKTHTITGAPQDPGLIVRTMQDLLQKMETMQEDRVVEAQLSYLEVYNETIRDLLSFEPSPTGGLDLREDDNGVVVAGLSRHTFEDASEVMEKLIRGNANRSKAPTEANQASSRSHAVLQVHIQHKDRASGAHATWTKAVLSIIDLAGSERASATKNRGERLHEGAKINRSLLALGNCINALCKPGNMAHHVPYRDSKLTRLLKFSLGGNCRVVMIANISPHPMHYEETHNTLMYANRAKEIRTKVEVNKVEVEAGVDQYLRIIEDLKQQVHALKSRQGQATTTTSQQAPDVLKNREDFSFLRDSLYPLLRRQRVIALHVADHLVQLEHRYAIARSIVDIFWGPGADAAVFDIVREESATIAEELKFTVEFCRERLGREEQRIKAAENRINAVVESLKASCTPEDNLFLADFLAQSRISIDLDVAREEARRSRESMVAIAKWSGNDACLAMAKFVATVGQDASTEAGGDPNPASTVREDAASLVRDIFLAYASLQQATLEELPPEEELADAEKLGGPRINVQVPSSPQTPEMSEEQHDIRFAAEIAARERMMETEEELDWQRQANSVFDGLKSSLDQPVANESKAELGAAQHSSPKRHRDATDIGEPATPQKKVHLGADEPMDMDADDDLVATPKANRTKGIVLGNRTGELLRSAIKNSSFIAPENGTPRAGEQSTALTSPIRATKIERRDSQSGGVGPIRLNSPARRKDRRSMIPIPSAVPVTGNPEVRSSRPPKTTPKPKSMLPQPLSPKQTRSKTRKA